MPYTDYPQSATNNAKKALKYRDESGNPNGCGTRVGWARANQLANREAISEDTVKRMASFNRHRQHKDVPYTEGCGGLMWDAWGGTSGINWAIRKSEEIDNMKNDSKRQFINYWMHDDGVVNMSIMGDIGWDWRASDFINILSEYKDLKFKANIYSPGGDVIDALAVYDYIKANNIDFEAYIYGWAASAATVIACAANYVAIGENSRYMIHNVTEGGQETSEAKAFTETLIDIYKAKTGKDKRWIRDKMNSETFFTAREAVAEGFCDKVVNAKSLAAFLNNNFSNQTDDKMANENSLLKRLAAKLGLAGDTDEQTEANVADALENETLNFAAKADVDALEAKISELSEAESKEDNTEILQLLETMTEAIEANKTALQENETKFENKVEEKAQEQESKIAELATKLNAVKVEAFKGETVKPDASGHKSEQDRQKTAIQLDAKAMIDRIKNRK